MLSHAVHGNAPTVILSTLRMMASVIPTWMTKTWQKTGSFSLNVIKAYDRSIEIQCFIAFQPTFEYFEAYLDFNDCLWHTPL